jgi:hypothetical protein
MTIWRQALFVSALLVAHVTALAQGTVDELSQAPAPVIDDSHDLYALAPFDRSFYEPPSYERRHVQHHWGGERNEPFIDPARVTRLVFGWSRHVGSKHRPGSNLPWYQQFQERNPGLGASVALGPCYGDQLECHVSLVYIDQNSLRGKAVTLGGGASKEIFRYQRLSVSAGVEAFLLLYRAGYSDKKIIGPLALPTLSLDFKPDKQTLIGIGVQVLPVRAGDARRIELYNVRVKADF